MYVHPVRRYETGHRGSTQHRGSRQHHDEEDFVDELRERSIPRTQYSFYERLSELSPTGWTENPQAITLGKYQELAEYKRDLYKKFPRDAESRMRKHNILSYDMRISHKLSSVLRHGGWELDEVARQINYYDDAYNVATDTSVTPGMIRICVLANYMDRVGRYVLSDPDLLWFAVHTNNKLRFKVEVRRSLPRRLPGHLQTMEEENGPNTWFILAKNNHNSALQKKVRSNLQQAGILIQMDSDHHSAFMQQVG